MTDIKITKKDLINSINIHYLKKGKLCQNLYKLSKTKLIEIFTDNNIEYVSSEQLKNEIISVETYNHLCDIIHCNFIIYENIPIEVITSIKQTTTNNELKIIIDKYNLQYDEKIVNIKELVYNIYNSYKIYCNKQNIENNIKYITLPTLKNVIKSL
jgi:hypothetical protein